MAALATAFACVWITVALYVAWLARNQRQLSTRVQELSALLAARSSEPKRSGKAA
jgi:CcmD family protein